MVSYLCEAGLSVAVIQSLSHARPLAFVTQRTAACQASLSRGVQWIFSGCCNKKQVPNKSQFWNRKRGVAQSNLILRSEKLCNAQQMHILLKSNSDYLRTKSKYFFFQYM